jgi:hypothetical protein
MRKAPRQRIETAAIKKSYTREVIEATTFLSEWDVVVCVIGISLEEAIRNVV